MFVARHSHKKYIFPIIFLSVIVAVLLLVVVSQSNELGRTRNILTTTQTSLAQTQAQLATTQASLAQTQAQLATTQTQLNTVEAQYARLTTGYGYMLNDPTYQQMWSFLATDQTKNHHYDPINYNCFNFSADVIANATKQHIRCGFVYITFPNSAHAIVVFDTTDKGLLYIEPQDDDQVNLQVGKHYSQCVILPSGYYILAPSYDDTIVNFTIIW